MHMAKSEGKHIYIFSLVLTICKARVNNTLIYKYMTGSDNKHCCLYVNDADMCFMNNSVQDAV